MVTERRLIRYEDLECGHFFRIGKRPDLGRFFKCQPWVSTTEDLEKLICFKADVEVFIDERKEANK